MMRALAVLFAFSISWAAHAIAPEDGIWHNPAQSGRGWVITTQNDLMVVATYTYAPSGPPTWYLSVGQYDDATKRFSGQLDGTTGGQCIGCPYRAPTSTGSAGAISIQFIDNERATLTQAGEQVPIEKFYYAYPAKNDRLYGTWAYAGDVALGIGDAEFLVFDRRFVGTDGTEYVAARRNFSTLGQALGRYSTATGKFLVLLDSSTSYYKTYLFNMEGSRLLDGRWWLHRKTDLPTGAGDYLAGVRVKERNDVGAKAANMQEYFERDAAEKYALMTDKADHGSPQLLDGEVAALTRALEAMRAADRAAE